METPLPSSPYEQPGSIEQPEAYAANIYNRPPQPQQQKHTMHMLCIADIH